VRIVNKKDTGNCSDFLPEECRGERKEMTSLRSLQATETDGSSACAAVTSHASVQYPHGRSDHGVVSNMPEREAPCIACNTIEQATGVYERGASEGGQGNPGGVFADDSTAVATPVMDQATERMPGNGPTDRLMVREGVFSIPRTCIA